MQLLRNLILRMVKDGVRNIQEFREWRKSEKNAAFMSKCLAYERLEGMPAATSLVQPFFHPTKPLIGLNYTQVAHVTLHAFPTGWTAPIRLCRGIVFDRKGKLVAFPFPKFFNYGETDSTRNLPDEPFEATLKNDGHLGIIFNYEGELFITTRGSFESKTSVIATRMLDAYREKWRGVYPENTTTLVEVIHPETHVIVEYGEAERFVVIGVFNRLSHRDCNYDSMVRHATLLGLPVADLWRGTNLEELIQLMYDHSVHNQEGYVVRFASGLRVKLKFKTYIALMLQDKLTVRWVMARLRDNSLENRRSDMPGEVQGEIDRLTGLVLGVKTVTGDRKAQLNYLHELEPEAERTPYYRGLCSKFHKWLGSRNVAVVDEEEDAA